MVFSGSATALVTPFDKNGNVNYFALKNLIEYQIASGTKALVILGTTGEASTLLDEERTKIIKFCVCEVSKRVPIIIGTGSNCTKTAIKYSIEAENLGADAVLVVTPYYNKCNQMGLYEHFKSIAKAIKIPVILYNVPSRTGVNILPQTVLKLSKIKNIVGIKEANSNITQHIELLSLLPKSFAVYSGDDLMAFPCIMIGAKGVISVTANAYPELVSNMCNFAILGDTQNAKRLHNYLYKINKVLFEDVNPIPIKSYLGLIGLKVGSTRLPLTKPSLQLLKILKEVKEYYEN